MPRKLTFEDYQNTAHLRNQQLISVTNETTPSKGNVVVFCHVCHSQFEQAAVAFRRAKTSGCPICKKLLAEAAAESGKKKKSKKKRDTSKWDFIKSRKDLIQYAEAQNNEYFAFILDRLHTPNEKPSKEEKSRLTEVHHIIPKHMDGPDSKWNLLRLLKQDHVLAHELLFKAYKSVADKTYLESVGSPVGRMYDLSEEDEKLLLANRAKADETRKREKTGIYAPGVSSLGGKASAKVKSAQRDAGYQALMSEPVRRVLNDGSTWQYRKTDLVLEVAGKEAKTLSEFRYILGNALKVDCKDKTRLLRDTTLTSSANVTSVISKAIRGERESAYGWKLLRIWDPPS